MIICFEGPDCAGKTTQARKLMDHIENHYPNMRPFYVHFPNHRREDIELILHKNYKDNNPYFIASSYMNDFYTTFHSDEFDGIKFIDMVSSSKYIMILDRYYYSSLIMCVHWPNKYTGVQMPENENQRVTFEEERKKYLENLFGFTGLMLNKFNLPCPDLNIVILPDLDIMLRRLKEKKYNDRFENNDMAVKVWREYSQASSGNFNMFRMNNEPIPPVVIKDTAILSLNPFGNAMISNMKEHLENSPNNTLTIDQISTQISQVFDSYISNRASIKNIKGESVDRLRELWKDDNIEDFKYVDSVKDFKAEARKDSSSTEANLKLGKTLINHNKRIMKVLIDDNEEKRVIENASVDELKMAKINYGLTDREFYICHKLGINIDDIINNPAKFILGSDYRPKDVKFVIHIMLKIINSDFVRSGKYSNSVKSVAHYLHSELERINYDNAGDV